MTELDEANRKRYLEIVEQLYDLDDKSMEFIKKRTTDEWQPVKEYQEFLKGVKYENQRYRFPVDFKNKTLTRTITQYDESYQLFTRYFSRVLGAIEVSYDDFLNNKIVYQKNVTKIKKVFEKWYLEHWRDFCSECSNSGLVSYDSHASSDEEKLKYINAFITKAYEKVGEKKKPSKNGLSLVISFNPCDWYLASTSESFSSCFNLNAAARGDGTGYVYSLGLPFLNSDVNRCFVYLTRGEMKEWEGIKVESVLARSWAFLDNEGKVDICKWYPNEIFNADALNEVIGLRMFRNSSSFKRCMYPFDPICTKTGAVISVYNDVGSWRLDKETGKIIHEGNQKCGQQKFTVRGTNIEDGNSTYRGIDNPPNEIRYIYSRWLKCGLSLKKLVGTYRCACCSSEDKGGFFRNHNFYCYDCYEDHRKKCSRCGSEYWEETADKERKPIIGRNGQKMDLCPNCYEHAKQHVCSICGTYDEDSVVVNGKRICNSCISKPQSEYVRANNGEVILKKDAYLIFDKINNKLIVAKAPKMDFEEYEDHIGADISPVFMRYRNGVLI